MDPEGKGRVDKDLAEGFFWKAIENGSQEARTNLVLLLLSEKKLSIYRSYDDRIVVAPTPSFWHGGSVQCAAQREKLGKIFDMIHSMNLDYCLQVSEGKPSFGPG